MRTRILLPLAAGILLAAPSVASADFAHVVTPGESLYSIAAADGLSVAQLAADNGLSTDSQLTTGATLMIPPQDGSGSAGTTADSGSGSGSGSGSDGSGSASASDTSTSSSDSGGAGTYVG